MTCAHDLPLCSSAVERGIVTGGIAAARTAIEAHVGALARELSELRKDYAFLNDATTTWADRAGELDEQITALRSSLAQVEGERDAAQEKWNASEEHIAKLRHTADVLMATALVVVTEDESQCEILRMEPSPAVKALRAALGSPDGGARHG